MIERVNHLVQKRNENEHENYVDDPTENMIVRAAVVLFYGLLACPEGHRVQPRNLWDAIDHGDQKHAKANEAEQNLKNLVLVGPFEASSCLELEDLCYVVKRSKNSGLAH